MKKNLLFIALLCATTLHAINDYTNQTFMFPKEIFGSFGLEQASWNNIVYNKKSYGFALQAYAYVQSSIPTATNSEYFLFDDLTTLTVQTGSDSNYNEETFTRNILGQWIGITEENYTGSFSLTPQQSQMGITLGFNQDLSKFCDMGFLRNLSFGISIPIVHIKNQLVYAGDSAILNALQGENYSVNQEAQLWQYLILDPNPQEVTGIATVKIQFDTKYQSKDDIQIATTSFVIVPGAASVTNEVLFQPMMGYNGHVALGSGITFQFPLSVSQDELSRICMFFGLENRFLFGNNQFRTIEIKNKPYSRYMPLYDRYTQTVVPGINVFTRECYVEPFNIINFITGFRLKHRESIAEVGYELWGKDTEKITLTNQSLWQNDRYGIANIGPDGILITGQTQTASQSTINYVDATAEAALPTPANIYIESKDLNFMTAAARAALIHRVYTSIGYGKCTEFRDHFLNLGLFIEISQSNAAVSNWGGWAKAGFTF